jgi:predicted metalloprotease
VVKPTIITNIFNLSEQLQPPQATATQRTAEELEMVNIVDLTLTETEKIWDKIFVEKGGVYKKPDVTIFTDRTSATCNKSENESEQFSLGTFYCPEEKRIYIDLSLHRDLKNRLDIPGDFAQGYIVAHEIGHHVQNLIGISEQIPAARLQLTSKKFQQVLQRLELQADCFAGMWAKQSLKQQQDVKPEEFTDALNAVTRFSREHLQQQKGDDLMPDPFTHGSSRLRLHWFTVGYNKGTLDGCDTFTTINP